MHGPTYWFLFHCNASHWYTGIDSFTDPHVMVQTSPSLVPRPGYKARLVHAFTAYTKNVLQVFKAKMKVWGIKAR